MFLVGLCWVGLPGVASAQVPRIQGQGTAASGMGNAFAAQADDPSALHYNPAGMTQLQGRSIHGRGTILRWVDKFHQSDRRDGPW